MALSPKDLAALLKKRGAVSEERAEVRVPSRGVIRRPKPVVARDIDRDRVTNVLRGLRTKTGGEMYGATKNEPDRPGLDGPTYWTGDPRRRERLDHYGNEGEGWDDEGWEAEYAGPLRDEVQVKIDAAFGPGLFDVSIGEKGHIHLTPPAAGQARLKE